MLVLSHNCQIPCSRPACVACHVQNGHIPKGRQRRAGLWGCESGRFSSAKRLQNDVWWWECNLWTSEPLNPWTVTFSDRDIKDEKYSSKPVPSTGYQVPPQLSLTQLRYHPESFWFYSWQPCQIHLNFKAYIWSGFVQWRMKALELST